MDAEERDAVRAALQRMFEDNLNPYGRVAESLARGIAREQAEQDQWNQFLPGHSGLTATVEIEPPTRNRLRITYAPDADGPLAAGEIVRTWAPARARPGATAPIGAAPGPAGPTGAGPSGAGQAGPGGAYSSVLILGSEGVDRFYAVRLSTRSHEADHRFFAIGAGPKDSHGRLSWVDLDRVFSVHIRGARRTRFIMDRDHFTRVADELYGRRGWAMDD
ncbi:hypothetical protein [Microbacterium deminutum]|uniref:Type II toxin-antitoxin system PemK/MazF family toxin n=1 Tax=Microbacterium deminutum TaxID=344164 RepID=A0ABN2RCG7_9MICO